MATADKKFTLLVEAMPGPGGTAAFDQQTAAMKKAEDAANKLAQANAKAANPSGTPSAADAQLAQARLSFEEKLAAAKAKLTQTTQSQTVATEALAGGALPKLAGAVGLAATAIAGARAVWQQMLADNDQLAKSWENLKQAGSDVFGGVVRDLTNNGDTLKSLFDSATKALGGTTEEMKKALGPFSDYVKLSTEATTAAEKFTKALNDQARAAELDREKLKTLGAERDSITKQLREQEDARIAAEREDTTNNPELTPEQKQAQLAALDQQEKDLKRQRRREDAVTAQEDAATELEMAQKALEERQKAEDEQRQRVKAARELDDARTAANDYKARKNADPNFFNGMDPGEAIKAEKAIEDRLKAAQGAARAAFGDTPFNDPKAEAETLRRAEQERIKAEQEAAKAQERFQREAIKAEEEQRAADTEAIREEERRKRHERQGGAESPEEPAPNKAAPPTPAEAAALPKGGDVDTSATGGEGGGRVDWDEAERLRQKYLSGRKLTYGETQKLKKAVRARKRGEGASDGGGEMPRGGSGGGGAGVYNNNSGGDGGGEAMNSKSMTSRVGLDAVANRGQQVQAPDGDGKRQSLNVGQAAIDQHGPGNVPFLKAMAASQAELAQITASLASHAKDATTAARQHAELAFTAHRESVLSHHQLTREVKGINMTMRRTVSNEHL